MPPQQGPHPQGSQQLFPCDTWAGYRQPFPPLLDEGKAVEGAVLTKEAENAKNVTCEIPSGTAAQPDDLGNVDDPPLCFSDLDNALDDDDDVCYDTDALCMGPTVSSSSWHHGNTNNTSSTVLGSSRPRPGVEIFVGGLTRSTRRDMLKDWFQPAGEVTEVRIARDKRRRRCRGYGYVRFATSEQANRAIETMHRYEFKPGRFLGVLPSDENRTLFVGGLREEWSCEYICELLRDKMPGLRKVEPIPDREDRCKIRTFCFLEFSSHAAAALVFERHQVEPQATHAGAAAPPSFLDGRASDVASEVAGMGSVAGTDVTSSAENSSYAFDRETRGLSSSSCPEMSCGVSLSAAIPELHGILQAGDAASGGPSLSSTSTIASPSTAAAVTSTTEPAACNHSFLYGDGSPLDFRDHHSCDSTVVVGGRNNGNMNSDGGNVNMAAGLDALNPWGQQRKSEGDVTGEESNSGGVGSFSTLFNNERTLSAATQLDASNAGASGTREPFHGWSKDTPTATRGVPLIVGGAMLKVDWADPLRYHIHLNGGIKGPCATQEMGAPIDNRPMPPGVQHHARGRSMGQGGVRGGGAGAPEWHRRNLAGMVRHVSEPSPRWHEVTRAGYNNNRGTARQYQQYTHHQSPHQHPQQQLLGLGGSPAGGHRHHMSYTGGSVSSSGVAAAERDRDGKTYTVTDPRSEGPSSLRRRSYYDAIPSSSLGRQNSCDGGGAGNGRARADSYAGPFSTPAGAHGHPAYPRGRSTGAGGPPPASQQQQQQPESDVRRGFVQPLFSSHSSSGHPAAGPRPASAFESSDLDRYRGGAQELGPNDIRRSSSTSTGVPKCSSGRSHHPCDSDRHAVHMFLNGSTRGGSIGGALAADGDDLHFLTRSCSANPPRKRDGNEDQPRQQHRGHPRSGGSSSWEPEYLLVDRVGEPWSASAAQGSRRRGGEDGSMTFTAWMDRGFRDKGESPSSECCAPGGGGYHYRGNPSPPHQVDLMEFGGRGSREPTGVLTGDNNGAAGALQRREAGWKQQQQLLHQRRGSRTSEVDSCATPNGTAQRRFSDPDMLREAISPSGFAAYKPGFDPTGGHPPPRRTCNTPLLQPIANRGSRIHAPSGGLGGEGGGRCGGGGNADAGLRSAGSYDTYSSTKTGAPPGFLVQQQPKGKPNTPPASAPLAAALSSVGSVGGGGGEKRWIQVSGGPGGDGAVGVGWTTCDGGGAGAGAGQDDARVGDHGQSRYAVAKVRTRQPLLWDVIGGGGDGNVQQSAGGGSSWGSAVLPPCGRDGDNSSF